MGNQQEHESKPDGSKAKEKDFFSELVGGDSTDSGEDQKDLPFPQFLVLANDLAAKWPQGTVEAWLLYKFQDKMVLLCTVYFLESLQIFVIFYLSFSVVCPLLHYSSVVSFAGGLESQGLKRPVQATRR
jgi:hypothetical protein